MKRVARVIEKENEQECFVRVTNETCSWSDTKEDEKIGCENNQQCDGRLLNMKRIKRKEGNVGD